MTSEDRVYLDPELVQLYDLENNWGPDFDLCVRLADSARSVLDLGCGTGQLAAALATGGRDVVGVDPAAAMLDVARRRPGGDRVEWVEADARALRLGRRFDLVVLTGHVFQVFLTPADQAAALRTIARHLAPGGRFVLDSRNPAFGAWRAWVPSASRRELTHPELGRVETWHDASHDPATGIVSYQTHYRIVASGRHLMSTSRLRFTPRDELDARIRDAGLQVTRWLGDWHEGPCTPACRELIPIGGLAPTAQQN